MSHNEDLRMLRCTGKNCEKRDVSAFLGRGICKTVVYPLLSPLLFVFVFGLFSSSSYGFGMFDDLGYKINEKIEFIEDSEYEFRFKIDKKCAYEVGVLIFSGNNNLGHIEKVVGVYSKIHLPAIVDIRITDIQSNVVFERQNFGGGKMGVRYGPNPTHLIAGTVVLPTQTYIAKIKINKVNISPSALGVETNLFISHAPKTICN